MHAALGVVVEQSGGHLRAPGIVHADEQNLWDVLRGRTLRLRQSREPVGGEPRGQ